jgi:multidrug efflux pump subunit AcrB
MDMMRDFVDDEVRPRMETVQDVARVQISGGAERQIQVLLDPGELAARGLTIADVRDALRARNEDVSGGEVESGKRRYLLRTIGRFDEVGEIGNLIVRRTGDSVTRLSDVADVRLDHFEITERDLVNAQPVIGLSVRREAGSNVIDIKYAMLDEMEAINEEVLNPAGMQLELTARMPATSRPRSGTSGSTSRSALGSRSRSSSPSFGPSGARPSP